MLETPVAFFIFNRPETTSAVFAEIAKAKPQKLLVVADGPRTDRDGEAEKCVMARAVVEQVDWDCELLVNFSDTNLGCKRRVSSGLDWVFEMCEEAIILEDDCLPHPTFFRFCEEILKYYRDDKRVMRISGINPLGGKYKVPYSYYFSRYTHIWGWASWRRAWRYYDVEMRLWPELRRTSLLLDVLGEAAFAEYYTKAFDETYEGRIDTWDYQWLFACWAQSGLMIVPTTNLITNIGFGENATHTVEPIPAMDNLATEEIAFPLTHPPLMTQDREADKLALGLICPWAVHQPGAYQWLRRALLPVTPDPVRKTISSLRRSYGNGS